MYYRINRVALVVRCPSWQTQCGTPSGQTAGRLTYNGWQRLGAESNRPGSVVFLGKGWCPPVDYNGLRMMMINSCRQICGKTNPILIVTHLQPKSLHFFGIQWVIAQADQRKRETVYVVIVCGRQTGVVCRELLIIQSLL